MEILKKEGRQQYAGDKDDDSYLRSAELPLTDIAGAVGWLIAKKFSGLSPIKEVLGC